MRLNLKNTPEQVELIKAMGSKDYTVAREAAEAFAAFLGPVVQQVLSQAGTASAIYTDAPYDEDDAPSYPLDLYYNDYDNMVSVVSQSIAGGLPTSHVEGMKELKISTYRLDSAVSLLRRYARRGRLDVVSKATERMAQEILVKQERNAWAVVLKALGEGSHGGNKHVIAATTESVFQLDDLNRLMTRMRRLNESFANGSPDSAYSNGVTDLYLSPEMMQQVRGFAYQPMNTRAGSTGSGSDTSTSIALPDNVRDGIFRAAGTQELYGINLVEMNEFGTGKKYNKLFDEFDSGNIAPDGSGGAHAFVEASDEILVGVDNSKGAFIRPVAQQHESNGSFTALADDQWSVRSEKLGFYGFLEEGRVCIDSRAVVGIAV
tara:strand:- start:1910 stop:3037 length:1128 start_codon:yes stop_codon:yes gene_type:complete